MIISFSIENWMSFRDPASFSMVASKERQHRERVPRVAKYQTSILPISAIYGGNASGKSNFFKALYFMQNLIVKGTRPDSKIPIEPYCLDSDSLKKPSRFRIELLIDEIIYEFSFAVTQEEVIEEKLVKITRSSEKTLYDRRENKIEFDPTLKDQDFLKFAFKGTRNNQLFLTNSVNQNIDHFRAIYNWFKDTLVLIAPDSRFGELGRFIREDTSLYTSMNEILSRLDTGISRLEEEEIPPENIPESLINEIMEDLEKKDTDEIMIGQVNISIKNGKLVAKKIVSIHSGSGGKEVKFEGNQESDGSQRVIHLLPAFLMASYPGSKKVFVIDEIDRSLHSIMTRRLIEGYLASCSSKSRSQLLMTTHDLLSMNQDIFRRDEMWVTERDREGCSELIALSDYQEIRYDKDIRKSYLQGRLGGIPNILFGSVTLTDQKKNTDAFQEKKA